jgi:hypothetical protein
MTSTYLVMLDEARQNFLQLENLFSALDTKASILIAIDAIILTSLTIIPEFNKQSHFIQLFVISLPVLSIAYAILCLYPRTWDRPCSEKIVSKYIDLELDPTVVQLAKTYAKWESELLSIYIEKLFCFKNSLKLVILSIALWVGLLLIFLFPLGFLGQHVRFCN